MPRYICKINNKYFEWSTVVDAIVTDLMTLDEFKEYYQQQYGKEGMRDLPDRLERVESKGTSCQICDHVNEIVPPKIRQMIK